MAFMAAGVTTTNLPFYEQPPLTEVACSVSISGQTAITPYWLSMAKI